MVCLQLDILAFTTTAAAGIVIPEENILPYIVVAQHFALLVVLTLRNRQSLFHSFNELEVKFCGFYNDLRDRKQDTYPADGSDMLLDLHFYRRCQPAFVLTVGAVIKPGLTVTGRAVPSGSAELTPGRELVYHIIAGLNFCSVQHCCFRAGGNTNGLTSCVYAKNDRLRIPGTTVEQLDGKGGALDYFCFSGFEQMSCF